MPKHAAFCERRTKLKFMNFGDFKIGFWHPFGPHAEETPEQIIRRKSDEIASNGWTLWSFQHRKTLASWCSTIRESGADKVFVFCSHSAATRNPSSKAIPCTRYRFADSSIWQPFPNGVKIPHPFGPGKKTAAAFVVQNLIYPMSVSSYPNIE